MSCPKSKPIQARSASLNGDNRGRLLQAMSDLAKSQQDLLARLGAMELAEPDAPLQIDQRKLHVFKSTDATQFQRGIVKLHRLK